MDRLWATPWDDSNRDLDPAGNFTLPSRVAAIESLRPALRARSGPVLVTGDAGVGKTWLWKRLRAEVPASWRWVAVDGSPAYDAGEFYKLVGHALGLAEPGGLAASRLALADFLKDRGSDGDSWILAVDEAHGLSDAILEELRLLSNRLGHPDGFAGLVLVGQTALARRLGLRALASLASRIAARAHLRPLDVEEARMLLDRTSPDLGWDRPTFERIHRDTAGNPKQLLRLATPSSSPAPRPLPVRAAAASPPAPPVLNLQPVEARTSRSWDSPVLGAAKPPLRVEEGLIEVGWDPEPAASAGDEEAAPSDEAPSPAAEEVIDDHYAALQAWNEWARNQGRTTPIDPADPAAVLADGPAVEIDCEEPTPEGHAEPDPDADPDVRAEGQHAFAPYGQLFSRIRQRNDSL